MIAIYYIIEVKLSSVRNGNLILSSFSLRIYISKWFNKHSSGKEHVKLFN